MAPARKPKSVNKRFSTINDATPETDGRNLGKSSLRKKKYSDKLGPQWSKEELERFYEAYRKYGKDWKKVAAVVHNRSIEMVEALYTTNRAYLSLPEGTASVAGLIAMMTDYYNILEESDSEQESNGASASWKSLKHKRQKVQLSDSKDIFQSRSIASSDGYLSLLNRRNCDGTQPRAVRKRTPRFPVSFSHKKDVAETYASPSKRGRNLEVDTNEDKVAHVAALTLAEASQRGGSPQISQTSYRRTEHITSSPAQSLERMHAQSDMGRAKLRDAIDENWVVSSIRSRGTENGDYARDTSSLMDMEGVGTIEVYKQGRKFYRKEKVEDIGNDQNDDGCEACSGTEEGINFSSLQGKVDIEVSNTKSERVSVHGQRKRSKKLFFEDETTGFHALQTLADLSLSTMESESSVQLKEERTVFDMDYKSSAPEATSTSHHEDKNILSGGKERALNAISRVDCTTSKMSKLVRDSSDDIIVTFETKEQLHPVDKTLKRKRKPTISKVVAEEGNKPVVKAKRSGQSFTFSKQWKLSEGSSDIDHQRVEADLAVSAEQIPVANYVSLSTKRRRRRKMSLPRSSTAKETKSYEKILKNRLKYSTSSHNKALLKERLSCHLSSHIVRRWCTFEWFYSAIDYPWFAKREFVEYLNHVGLGHIPRLTRVEWGVIRSSLGKPRRFSEHFLYEEREKLRQYRESVRKHYNELRAGIREGLPTDLARPLSVGQRVIALHPKTRELYDGSVLTVDHDKCRVQFDSPEIGVEFVMDIDCMPLNSLDNMPEALRRQNFVTEKFSLISKKEPQINGQLSFEGSLMSASSGHMERASSPVNSMLKQGEVDANRAVSQAKAAAIDVVQVSYTQTCILAQNQAKEADIRAISEMNRALDRKEALLMELRSTNNDVVEKQNNGDCSLKDSEPFRKHYAMVSSALLDLRQRNTYPGNTLPPWMKLPTNSSVHFGLTSSDNSAISQESACSIVEIVKGSRLKAHTMVDAAIQAFTLRKEGEDAFVRIGQALDSIDNQQLTSGSRLPVISCQQQDNGSLGNHNRMTFYTSEPLVTSDASVKRLCNESDKNEAQIPSELITSCVAALLMIQTCTERQYPPADVAQILDSALTSLHPCCPQNLPIYREIQMCVGRIKTQILALIPT